MRVPRVARAVAGATAAALAAAAVVWAFPVYFRADDALYLEWAAGHASPAAALRPGSGTVLGVFRPLQDLAWWVLFRLFGLHPAPYQLLVTLLFLAGLALLVWLARRLFSPAAGWWTLVAFAVFFSYLFSVVFWFSDLSFVLESVLMLSAIALFAEALAGRFGFAWTIAADGLAVLAKEPAAVIVPAACAALLLAEWRALETSRRRRGALTVVALAAVGATVALLHPSVRERQGDLLTGDVLERWRFYAGELSGGAGAGLVALALVALWLRLRPREGPRALALWLPVGIALAAGLLLRRVPAVGLAVLVACLLGQLALRRREGVGAAWFVVPLLGLLTISFAVRTYLFEAALGLALVAGATLAELATKARSDLRRAPRAVTGALLVVLTLALLVAGPRLAAGARTRVSALDLVSAARLNFRAAVAALLDPRVAGPPVVVVDYADEGLDYVRDILPLPEVEKARRQKTMMSHELAAFLAVAGARDRAVITLAAFMRLPAGSPALLFVMNTGEDTFATQLPLQRHLLFESVRGGEAARVYRVVR